MRNHPLPNALIESFYRRWQAFFDGADKRVWRFDPLRQDGYFPPDVSETAKGHGIKDLKERLRELGVI